MWSALHPPTRARVAIKLLPSTTDAERAGVRHEVEAMARLRHRNVVAVHDAGEDGDLAWFAMELATGTLRERPPATARALDTVLGSLLDALAHAHARGVTHRDLKPANLLWSASGEVLLSDFGVARVRGVADRLPTAGSAGWRAPEQGDPEAEQGPWTDLYAVGRLAAAWADPGDDPLAEWAEWLSRPDPGLRPRCAAEARLHLRPALGASARPLPRELTEATRPAGGSAPVPPSPSRLAPALPVPARHREAAPLPDHLLRTSSRLLLGWRVPAVVGREEEQDRLWDALRRSVEGPVAAALRGREGAGRSFLAAWLGHRAAEVGASVWAWGAAATPEERLAAIGLVDGARTARWVHRRGGSEALVARRATPDDRLLTDLLALEAGPRVVLVDGGPVEPWWTEVRRAGLPVLLVVVGEGPEDAAPIELAALDDQATRSALAELLPLAPAFAADLVDRCDGRPGLARRWLQALSDAGELVRGPTGFTASGWPRWRVPGPELGPWRERWRAEAPEGRHRAVIGALTARGQDPRWRQVCLEQADADQARGAAEVLGDDRTLLRARARWWAGDPEGAAEDEIAALDAAIAASADYATVLAHAERLLAVLDAGRGPAHPRYRTTLRNHMHCRLRCGDLAGGEAEALAFLEREDLDPTDRGSALSLLASAATFRGDPESALRWLDAIPPDAIERGHTWRIARAYALGRLGRWEDQARATRVPDPPADLLRMRASALVELGREAEAEEALAAAGERARGVELAALHQVRGRLLARRGDFPGAAEEARRAADLAGGAVERLVPATDAALYQLLAGRPEQARAEAEPLIERARSVRFAEMETLLALVCWASTDEATAAHAHAREAIEGLAAGALDPAAVEPVLRLALARSSPDLRAEVADRLGIG